MLNLVLKSGEGIQLGEDIIIKVKSDCRTTVAIDAPRSVNIKRLSADSEELESVKALKSEKTEITAESVKPEEVQPKKKSPKCIVINSNYPHQ
jgi:sRNA-binding carbon storage regulator CsrA